MTTTQSPLKPTPCPYTVELLDKDLVPLGKVSVASLTVWRGAADQGPEAGRWAGELATWMNLNQKNTNIHSIKKFAALTVSGLFAGVEKLRLTPYVWLSVVSTVALSASAFCGVVNTSFGPVEVSVTAKGKKAVLKYKDVTYYYVNKDVDGKNVAGISGYENDGKPNEKKWHLMLLILL